MWCDMPQCYVRIRGRGRRTLPRRRRGRLDQLSRPNSYRGYLERRYKGRGRGPDPQHQWKRLPRAASLGDRVGRDDLCQEREPEVPEEQRIRFRIGINLGDVIVEEHDIFGDGVNVASRLEALAEPGGVCVSRVVRDQ